MAVSSTTSTSSSAQFGQLMQSFVTIAQAEYPGQSKNSIGLTKSDIGDYLSQNGSDASNPNLQGAEYLYDNFDQLAPLTSSTKNKIYADGLVTLAVGNGVGTDNSATATDTSTGTAGTTGTTTTGTGTTSTTTQPSGWPPVIYIPVPASQMGESGSGFPSSGFNGPGSLGGFSGGGFPGSGFGSSDSGTLGSSNMGALGSSGLGSLGSSGLGDVGLGSDFSGASNPFSGGYAGQADPNQELMMMMTMMQTMIQMMTSFFSNQSGLNQSATGATV